MLGMVRADGGVLRLEQLAQRDGPLRIARQLLLNAPCELAERLRDALRCRRQVLVAKKLRDVVAHVASVSCLSSSSQPQSSPSSNPPLWCVVSMRYSPRTCAVRSSTRRPGYRPGIMSALQRTTPPLPSSGDSSRPLPGPSTIPCSCSAL